MTKNIKDLQQVGNDHVELALTSFDRLSKGAQAIAVEIADYSKQSFEQGSAAVEKLLAAGTFDKAVEIQGEYVRTAYEGFVARTAKLGELYATLAQESYRPFESYLTKAVR
jgi:hypothetical protein